MPGLITNPGKIWLAVEPVDMRRGIDGLSMVVQQYLEQTPCAGSAFVFCNRANNRIKVLLWDGTGVWLCQRRLHQGKFVWPKLNECSFVLTPAQWNWLIAGVNWQRLSALPPAHLIANTGGGYFSKEWISFGVLQQGIEKQTKPFTSMLLRPLFSGKSSNTPAFLLAVLKHLDVIKISEKRGYECGDIDAFVA